MPTIIPFIKGTIFFILGHVKKFLFHLNFISGKWLVWNSYHNNCSAKFIFKIVTDTIFSSVNHKKYSSIIIFTLVNVIFNCCFCFTWSFHFFKALLLSNKGLVIYVFCPFIETFFFIFMACKHYQDSAFDFLNNKNTI